MCARTLNTIAETINEATPQIWEGIRADIENGGAASGESFTVIGRLYECPDMENYYPGVKHGFKIKTEVRYDIGEGISFEANINDLRKRCLNAFESYLASIGDPEISIKTAFAISIESDDAAQNAVFVLAAVGNISNPVICDMPMTQVAISHILSELDPSLGVYRHDGYLFGESKVADSDFAMITNAITGARAGIEVAIRGDLSRAIKSLHGDGPIVVLARLYEPSSEGYADTKTEMLFVIGGEVDDEKLATTLQELRKRCDAAVEEFHKDVSNRHVESAYLTSIWAGPIEKAALVFAGVGSMCYIDAMPRTNNELDGILMTIGANASPTYSGLEFGNIFGRPMEEPEED